MQDDNMKEQGQMPAGCSCDCKDCADGKHEMCMTGKCTMKSKPSDGGMDNGGSMDGGDMGGDKGDAGMGDSEDKDESDQGGMTQ